MGYWKGSGLAMLIDLISASLSDGNPTHNLLKPRDQYGVSQVFIAFSMEKLECTDYANTMVDKIIEFVHSAKPEQEDGNVFYPGERTLNTRKENSEKGIPVDDAVWKKITEI